MKPGRRVADPAKKDLMGTYRADRHATITEIASPPKSVPLPPAYLTADALSVWREEHPRVVACGAVEADSSIFARYCTYEANFRAMVAAGGVPKSAMLTVLRQYAELLGIAGQRSRLMKGGAPDKPASSPFTIRPN